MADLSTAWRGTIANRLAKFVGKTCPKGQLPTLDGNLQYKTTAKGGQQRGEEIYYYKCWVCHNQFAKAAPQLKDLFKRPTFSTTDDPISDQT